MGVTRSICINNSMVHGICNYNCITCNVNKLTYKGPKVYQEKKVTIQLIKRIQEAAEESLYIRHVDNSGSGECTLHPEFEERMFLFGEMLRNWRTKIPAPIVSVVTNGFNLVDEKILKALVNNKIDLRVSFPTPVPQHYGLIMRQNEQQGEELLKQVLCGIKNALTMVAEKKINRLDFHISPPYYHYIRSDFLQTVDVLTRLAAQHGVNVIHLEMFPALTNRGGKVGIYQEKVDLYNDLFKKYNAKIENGVKIDMYLSNRRFLPRILDYWDVLHSFSHPCLYLANIFLSPFGDSCCCNDQEVNEKIGNINSNSLKEIMKMRKNTFLKICRSCSHNPDKCLEYGFLPLYHFMVKMKKILINKGKII